MRLAKILILLNAVLFIVYGLGYLFCPHYFSLLVTGSSLFSVTGTIDTRATYGGISLGFGVLLLYCNKNPRNIIMGIWAIILVVGGMALGRIIGMVLDGTPKPIMYIFLVLELIIIIASLVSLRELQMFEQRDKRLPFS